jgi:hypothetical protein
MSLVLFKVLEKRLDIRPQKKKIPPCEELRGPQASQVRPTLPTRLVSFPNREPKVLFVQSILT